MSAAQKRQIFYSNMKLLGFNPAACIPTGTLVAFNVDMFKVPNQAGFQAIAYFLFTRLDSNRAEREFRDFTPVRDRKRAQLFRMVVTEWLSQIAQDDPDSGLPRIFPGIFMSPGGDKFCHLMFAFSSYVVRYVIINEHGIKDRDMLYRPILSPQNTELFPGMEHIVHCANISCRKKFFEKLQTREDLHKFWKKSGSDMAKDYRRLSKEVREREADIQSLLDEQKEKGVHCPVRLDRTQPALTPSKHGRLLDVSDESVRRQKKVQQVRDLWHTLEGFLTSINDQQQIVSSILSDVVDEWKLDAGELDLRVPDVLLRECRNELVKRDIGNIYKAGKLDLSSTLNLWNLSLHLYLERLEDGQRIDLSDQLKQLQPKVHAQACELHSCKQLANDLRDQLIPELKESIRQQMAKLSAAGLEHSTCSKLPYSLQPFSPPLSFDLNKASDADLQATKMTFTPDMLPQESTPDAVSRIMKSITKALKPGRPACADLTNQQTAYSDVLDRSAGITVSPLAQGRVVHRRRVCGTGTSSRKEDSLSRLSSEVNVKRVGSKQLTKVLKDTEDSDGVLFSPPDATAPSESVEQLAMYVQETLPVGSTPSSSSLHAHSGGGQTALTPQKEAAPATEREAASMTQEASSITQKEAARRRMCAQVSKTSLNCSQSPSDLLAARIAQSIGDLGSGDQPPASSLSFSPSALDSLYSFSNVLDELGTSGFVSRDKIGRTPTAANQSKGQGGATTKLKGRVIFPSPMCDEDEEEIITVEVKETQPSSDSSSSNISPRLADNDLSQLASWVDEGSRPHVIDSKMSASGLRTPGSRTAGQRIMDGVLDEQPLFFESPSIGDIEIDADLLELQSSGLNWLQTTPQPAPQPVPQLTRLPASLATLGQKSGESSSQGGRQPTLTSLEELVAKFEEVKKKSSTAAANQEQLAAAMAARSPPTGRPKEEDW